MRILLSLIAALALAETTADEVEVRALVQKYVDARQTRDPRAIESLFTEDADQLVSDGTWRRGREAVVKGTLESSARSSGHRTIAVQSVRFVAPDVAVADGPYTLAGGSSGANAREMWTSILVVRRDGLWKIAGIRNMLPAK